MLSAPARAACSGSAWSAAPRKAACDRRPCRPPSAWQCLSLSRRSSPVARVLARTQELPPPGPARVRRASALIDGVTDAAALVPYVHRTAAAARLQLSDV
jgi:hypothetical protein